MHQLFREHKDYLVSNYIRTQSSCCHIPFEITALCLNFYDDTVYWVIGNDEMPKFLNTKNGNYLEGPQFNFDGIVFKNTLTPNGWLVQDAGYIGYYLEVKHLPADVQYVMVYFILYCKESNLMFKRSQIYRIGLSAHGWKIPLELCRNCKSLTFGCQVDVLQIKYQPTSDKMNYIKETVELSKNVDFVWKIENKLLRNFKECSAGIKFSSDNFDNDAWCLRCAPKGQHNNDVDMLDIFGDEFDALLLGLRLLKVPFGVKSVTIDYILSAHFNDDNDNRLKIWKNVENITVGQNWTHWPATVFPSQLLDELHSELWFSVKIQVQEMEMY